MLLRFAKIYLFLHPSGHSRLACVARLKSKLFCSLYQRDSNRFAGVGTDVSRYMYPHLDQCSPGVTNQELAAHFFRTSWDSSYFHSCWFELAIRVQRYLCNESVAV
jgi:hypothetical protein